MSHPVRAIYTEGRLQLLDPVDLIEGQEIALTILSDAERVRAALGDLRVEMASLSDHDVDETALAREVEEAFQGQSPLSEILIQERREGP
jgi:predicted DNA-binding antitoxin AbrB/MazE fold protein